MALSTLLLGLRTSIEENLFVGKARWEIVIAKVAQQEDEPHADYYDEQVWTFLLACGYAVGGPEGVYALEDLLTGGAGTWRTSHKIWFEVLPTPPRFQEGNTNVDLAVGDIRLRSGVEGGIELDPESMPNWVCLTEAKWYSDIDTKVSNQRERNQLARVAENAACLQSEGAIVDRPIVTLLTPRRFRDSKLRSRLYVYKYHEYRDDPARLAFEWRAMDNAMPPRSNSGWRYPENPDERARSIRFHWVTYDDLLSEDNLPDTPIRDALVRAFEDWTP